MKIWDKFWKWFLLKISNTTQWRQQFWGRELWGEDAWPSLEMSLAFADRETCRYLCSLPHDNKLTSHANSFFCLITYFIFKCAHCRFLASKPKLKSCQLFILYHPRAGRCLGSLIVVLSWGQSSYEWVWAWKMHKPYLPLFRPANFNLNKWSAKFNFNLAPTKYHPSLQKGKEVLGCYFEY